MTEDEAKTKWCPMMKIYAFDPLTEQPVTSLCLGSACMMWRNLDGGMPSEPPYVGGYCGLAGKL